jgi:hypothetical protein
MMNNRKLAFAFAAGVAFAVVALAVWLFVDLTLLRSRVNAQSSGSIDGVAIPSKTLAPYTRLNAMDDLRIAEHSCQSGFCHPIKDLCGHRPNRQSVGNQRFGDQASFYVVTKPSSGSSGPAFRVIPPDMCRRELSDFSFVRAPGLGEGCIKAEGFETNLTFHQSHRFRVMLSGSACANGKGSFTTTMSAS